MPQLSGNWQKYELDAADVIKRRPKKWAHLHHPGNLSTNLPNPKKKVARGVPPPSGRGKRPKSGPPLLQHA